MKFGDPLPARLALIKELAADTTRPVWQLRYKGQLEQLPIHRVPLDFPKYRLNNGRTQAAQLALLAKREDLPSDLFSVDQESDQAQEQQHSILKGMIGSPSLVDFFRQNDQEQPFILNHLGFIINGNRRVCALRELRELEARPSPDLVAKFSYIDVVVLPPGTERDWDELEARLQIHEDIQQDYSWTSTAVMLRKRRDEHSYSMEELSTLYKMSRTEIEESVDMLSLAEDYLRLREKPEQFGTVDKDEFAFRQLRKHRLRVPGGEPKRDIFQLMSYLLIDPPSDPEADAGGRVYAVIPRLYKHLDAVIPAIQDAVGPLTPDETAGEDLELLGIKPSPLTRLARQIRSSEQSGALREVVVEAIAGEEAKAKEIERGKRSLLSLKRAEAELRDALFSWQEDTETSGMTTYLASCSRLIEQITDRLDANPGD